jgi:hypothetical protein
MTVARFLKRHAALLEGGDKAALSVGKAQRTARHRCPARRGLDGRQFRQGKAGPARQPCSNFRASPRIGDRKQLGAVDAGKPFEVMQQAGARDRDHEHQHCAPATRHCGPPSTPRKAGRSMRRCATSAVMSSRSGRGPQSRRLRHGWRCPRRSGAHRDLCVGAGHLRAQVNEAVQTGLKANGEIGEPSLHLEVLSRINTTQEELRHASTYRARHGGRGRARQARPGACPWHVPVVGIDPRRERVDLENERGKRFEFRPDKLRPQGEHDPLRLYELKDLALHGGDRIRWTHTDHKRGCSMPIRPGSRGSMQGPCV